MVNLHFAKVDTTPEGKNSIYSTEFDTHALETAMLMLGTQRIVASIYSELFWFLLVSRLPGLVLCPVASALVRAAALQKHSEAAEKPTSVAYYQGRL